MPGGASWAYTVNSTFPYSVRVWSLEDTPTLCIRRSGFPVFGKWCPQRHRSPLLPFESRPRFQAETDSGLNSQGSFSRCGIFNPGVFVVLQTQSERESGRYKRL